MDITTLRSLSVVLMALAAIGICWWTFSPRRKKRFEEASQLPFADEDRECAENTHEKRTALEKQ